jgi:hypothetical protein
MLNVLKTAVFKSVAVPVLFVAVRAFIDPHYSDPQCGIRLVNQSAPEHFAKHPVWKDLIYDDSCQVTSVILGCSVAGDSCQTIVPPFPSHFLSRPSLDRAPPSTTTSRRTRPTLSRASS